MGERKAAEGWTRTMRYDGEEIELRRGRGGWYADPKWLDALDEALHERRPVVYEGQEGFFVTRISVRQDAGSDMRVYVEAWKPAAFRDPPKWMRENPPYWMEGDDDR